MASEDIIVQKSGDLYLVGNQREAICVDVDEESTSDIMNAQSLFAHIHVNDPWEVITDREQLPELVRAAVEQFAARRRP